ncbi:MAG: hypothetical protein AAGJ29_00945 [Pseudomonadota bacterium]
MIELKLVPVPANSEQFELEITIDADGLEMFEEALKLMKSGKNDHIHFFDEHWGVGHIQSDRSATKHWIPHLVLYSK